MWLPDFAGSAWRGAFGWALKRTVCAMRLRPCEGCMLLTSCIFPYIFDTRPHEGATRMRVYDRVPHPYTLMPEQPARRLLAPGDTTTVEVTLIGRACRYVAYALRALEIAGARGLRTKRTPLRLVNASSSAPGSHRPGSVFYQSGGECAPPKPKVPIPPPCPRQVEISFLTPLRLKQNGRLVAPGRFTPQHLLVSLIRRISMLSYFHADRPLEADFVALKECAAKVPLVESDLGWREVTRRSSRQRTTMQMGGLVGRARLDLADAGALWPFLWLGQWVHAGRGTTMGLGSFVLGDAAPHDRGKLI